MGLKIVCVLSCLAFAAVPLRAEDAAHQRSAAGPGLRATTGAGTPVGFAGLEGFFGWKKLELAAGTGKGWTGTQYAAMLKVYPGKKRAFHLGAGPSYGIHEGEAVSQFRNPVTGKKFTDIKVEFKDRFYWLNAEAGLTGYGKEGAGKGFFYTLALGGAYLYDARYTTLSVSNGIQTIAGLVLEPVSLLDMELQRPTFKEGSVLPYFSVSLGYRF